MFLFFLLFVCLSSVFITKKKPIRHKRSLIDAKMRRTNSCVRFRIGGEIWIQLQVSHIYLATWIATEVKTGAVIKSFPIKNASMTLLSLWSYVIFCGYLLNKVGLCSLSFRGIGNHKERE